MHSLPTRFIIVFGLFILLSSTIMDFLLSIALLTQVLPYVLIWESQLQIKLLDIKNIAKATATASDRNLSATNKVSNMINGFSTGK